MANKKRKNTPGTQKKGTKATTTTTTTAIGSSKSAQPTSGSKGKSSRSGDSDRNRDRVGGRNQRVFDSFPLHLVPDNEYAGKDHGRELRELCKGRVWVIPSFFSHKECRAWIEFCESFGDNDGNGSNGSNGTNGGGGGGSGGGFQYTSLPGSKYMANRECYRLQQENAVELSERIFQRLRKLTLSNDRVENGEPTSILSRLQSETADLFPPNPRNNNRNCNCNCNYEPIHCNPNIRVYRYDEGHSFGKHVDGSDVVPGCGTTEMTMLVYLSACSGGATRFHKGFGRRASSFAFEPEVGALLLHVHGKHCLEHEADVVTGGQKYVLRTDLVYGNR